MSDILVVLPLLVFIAFLWFSYLNVSLLVTIIKEKNKDNTLVSCLNSVGKIFYTVLAIIYIIVAVGGLGYTIYGFFTELNTVSYVVINVMTVISILCSYLFQQIIFVGNKQMLIGRVILDYRKIKRLTYPKNSSMRFVYGQKSYNTSLRFIDVSALKKYLQKVR